MTQPSTGKSSVTTLPGSNEVEVTDWFAGQLRAALQNPLLYIPKTFETWMADRVAVAGLDIPIGQIVGFSQVFTADNVSTQESTTSATYTDLTTAGPSLTLPDGIYVVLWAASIENTTSGGAGEMALNVNGSITGDPVKAGGSSEFISAARVAVLTLNTGGSNTVTAKYRAPSGIGTAQFYGRSLIALKQSNK